MMYFRQYFAVFLLSKILAKKCTEGEYCVHSVKRDVVVYICVNIGLDGGTFEHKIWVGKILSFMGFFFNR